MDPHFLTIKKSLYENLVFKTHEVYLPSQSELKACEEVCCNEMTLKPK